MFAVRAARDFDGEDFRAGGGTVFMEESRSASTGGEQVIADRRSVAALFGGPATGVQRPIQVPQAPSLPNDS